MASGWTNRGKKLILDTYFRGAAAPTNLYLALVTDAVAPTADTNTLGQLTEVAAGNGYTAGGYQLNRNATDFDTLTENDSDDRAELQVKDVVFTGTGGPLPGSGDGARYAVLTTDEGTVANRQVLAYFDLVTARTVANGQNLSLQDLELRGREAA